jgi:5-methylcytosine-specific restriction endonuclease McrBC GTP-binding regulatory subunit McrB
VNVDETTYMFSPKVLDRANTIEFNSVDLDSYGLGGAGHAATFHLRDGVPLEGLLAASRRPGPDDWMTTTMRAQERIRAIHSLMAEYNLHFGYRVANEIARYLALTKEFVGEDQLDFALDLQVLQKVLPKLSGSRAKLEQPLEALLEHLEGEGLNMSAAKVGRMLSTVRTVGFVSFVE